MIKKALLVLLLAVAGVLVYAAMQPDSFQVHRTATIQAPPEKIIAYLEDFHQWGLWSPYEKLDPSMKRTFQGPDKGVGAVYEWSGNSQAGSGRMEIRRVDPASRVVIQLDFTSPFEAHNTAEFALAPAAGGTQVTWTMSGPQPYVAKVMCVFVSMDRMVGKDFEAGLQSLKSLAEQR